MSKEFGLPSSGEVSVPSLGRIFDHATNSYKFLFFLALLDSLERRLFEHPIVLALDELVQDMLVRAWYPHVYFKLSFGKQDQTTKQLDKISVATIEESRSKFDPRNNERLKQLLADRKSEFKDLSRFVPQRLIRPFFPETSGEKDHVVDSMVAELSGEYFVARKPLYRLVDKQTIEVHPEWCTYLRDNFAIVKGWACWHYLQYMQKANPLVPNLAGKLFPPIERDSMGMQTKFWKSIIGSTEVSCIYSGEILSAGDFALDHFLPWSFVVHNELWNLAPVTTRANSAKSDRLPSEKYLDSFISAQHLALRFAREHQSSKWQEIARSYLIRLQLQLDEELLDKQKLESAYRQLYRPQFDLATINGFEKGWSYKG